MNEILEFLGNGATFYLATCDDGQPRVRPFGFAMCYEGKLYFCTGNKKDVYKQMKANPNIEVCAMNAKGEWLRLSGKAVLATSVQAEQEAFKVMPSLADVYPGKENNEDFEVFYISEGVATVYSFTQAPRTVEF